MQANLKEQTEEVPIEEEEEEGLEERLAKRKAKKFEKVNKNLKTNTKIGTRADKILRDCKEAFGVEGSGKWSISEVERAVKKQLEKIGKMLDDVMRGADKETEMIVKKLKMKGKEMVKRAE